MLSGVATKGRLSIMWAKSLTLTEMMMGGACLICLISNAMYDVIFYRRKVSYCDRNRIWGNGHTLSEIESAGRVGWGVITEVFSIMLTCQEQILGPEIKMQQGVLLTLPSRSYPGTFATFPLHTVVLMVPPGQGCALSWAHCGNHPRTAGRNTFEPIPLTSI